jgi:aldehyde dehydrogenase (NAD+)
MSEHSSAAPPLAPGFTREGVGPRAGVPAGGPALLATADIDSVFERQRAHRWEVRRRTAAERVARLRQLKRAIVARREEILDAMHADFRKNRSEAELSEIQLVLNELNAAIAGTPAWMRPVKVATPPHLFGTRSRIHYEPRGVVLIVAAWNYPFALLFAPLAAAVAAGNCVFLRPSEKVPHTSAVAARILGDVFPADEAVLVGGDRSTAQYLLGLPFDHVFFTGSTPVGHTVMAAAAARLTSVTLELGGKSPAIVDETADLEHAARCVMWGKFVNAGQTCVAPDYALVHETRLEGFCDAARRVLEDFYGASEDARQASEDYCRMIDEPSCARVAALLDDAVRSGARVEIGGRVDVAQRYVAPTILSGVRRDAAIMQDEIFGPVLPVLTYRTQDEAIDYLRGRPKPLAMYVFSESPHNVDDLLTRTTAGGTVVNNCLIHLVNPHLPFGGVGESGFGRYHGRFGFETFSHARAVLVQGRPRLSQMFYPPYARLKQGWLGRVLAVARRLRD